MKLSEKGKKAVFFGTAAAVVAAAAIVITAVINSGKIPAEYTELSGTGTLECKVEACGTIEPLMKYVQKSSVDAAVRELSVKSGDRVEAGDTIAYLDSEYTDMLFSLMRQKDEAEMLVAGGNTEAQTTCDAISGQIDSLLENPTAQMNIFIKAEVSGRICRINIENGKSIAMGDTLFEVDDDRVYTVNIAVPQWAPLLSYGSTVTLCNSEGKELDFCGKIVKRSDTADANLYSLSIEGDCGDYYEDFSLAYVKLDFGSADGFILPRDIVLRDGAADYVFVCENGTAKRRDVTVSLSDGKSVCITDGLKSGDKVLTSASELSDGKKVKLING